MKIVGVDCATVDAKVGLALGTLEEGCLEIREATLCTRERLAASTITQWLEGSGIAALIAMDAPLGWPKYLAESLITHRAGAAIAVSPDAMFRRATDLFIQRKLKKTPLDVGADRIARTAYSALRLLADLRTKLAAPIPLAWTSVVSEIAVIEVYPAATLVAHNIRSKGYKKRDQVDERHEIVKELCQRMTILGSVPDLKRSADLLDAVVCVLAGADFICQRAMGPEDRTLAEREGWIWVSPREA